MFLLEKLPIHKIDFSKLLMSEGGQKMEDERQKKSKQTEDRRRKTGGI